MKKDVIIPSLGESIDTAFISSWIVAEGDYVDEGASLFELESDKATVEVPAPVSGKISIVKEAETEVSIGDVVARIDTDVIPEQKNSAEKSETSDAAEKKEPEETSAGNRQQSNKGKEKAVAPSAKPVMAEKNIGADEIEGSGARGTVLKGDALAAGTKKENDSKQHRGQTDGSECGDGNDTDEQKQERVPMSRIRQKISENLVQSKQQSAHLTTFNEIDLHDVMELRKGYQEQFVKTHGIKLGFMSFFIKAACEALKLYPEANSFIEGTDIIYNRYYNIGVAVSTEKGLMVPVIRNADRMELHQLELAVADLADRARDKKLIIDELTGGTFSITNGGIFGSLLSTPIPTPPQSAILGMHTIQKRPVVIDDQIVIRPMMYVALTYDHRIMDGREAVGFLKKIKSFVEEPEKLLLHI